MEEIKYRREDEMKDSGIDGIGYIPKDWEINQLKFHLSRICNGTTAPQTENGDLLVTRIETISNGVINFNKVGKIKKDSKVSQYKLQKGDILLSHINSLKMVGNIALYESNIPLYHGMNLLRLITKDNYRWFYYVLKSTYFRNSCEAIAKPAINQASISTTNLKQIKIMKVNKDEQQKIANFLDYKTSQFDSIISKKEKLIEKLEESKKSLISEVVTGKVKIVDGEIVERKADEMKDSGVEWLGMIPKDWEVTKIKYTTHMNKRTLSNKEKKSLEISYIDIGSVDSTGKVNNIQKYTFEEAPSRARRIVKAGDVIVSTVRTYLRAIAFIEEKYNNYICSTGFAVFSPIKSKINSKYFYYLIKSEEYINQIVSRSVGVSYPAINSSEIYDFPCVYPSLKKQNEIAIFLNKKIKDINNIINKTKTQIQKLKEAKQSLISEAVTGKIDLRDWEIKEVDES